MGWGGRAKNSEKKKVVKFKFPWKPMHLESEQNSGHGDSNELNILGGDFNILHTLPG